MAYCTKEQVADEFNGMPSGTFSSSTNPTDTTVDRWIAEADVLVDSKVGLRYTTPITDATDLILMRTISIMLVSARVRRRLNKVGPDGESSKVKVTDTHTQAMKMLDQIAKGEILLTEDSTLKNSDAGISAFTTSLECPHTFKKSCDQW